VADYASRLSVSLTGDSTTKFFTKSRTHVATGYTRIVIGDRGPYVEFAPEMIIENAMREADAVHTYYLELRTIPDDVKVYFQVYRVEYADYVPGLCYVSPFELYDETGTVLIEPIR